MNKKALPVKQIVFIASALLLVALLYFAPRYGSDKHNDKAEQTKDKESEAGFESRLKEAIHMGFKRCLIPKRNMKGISDDIRQKIEIVGVSLVEEAIDAVIK